MKLLMAATLLALVSLASCRQLTGKRVRGNGTIVTESRATGAFRSVEVSGNIELVLRQDSASAVKVETDANIQPYVEVLVKDGALLVRPRDNARLKPSRKVTVYVNNPVLAGVEASGACSVKSENRIMEPGSFTIGLSGACDATLALQSPAVKAKLSGATSLQLSGETRDFSVDGSGRTTVKAFDLLSENTRIELSGAGSAQVYASVKLEVKVSGAADVEYRGNATVDQRVSGAGSVKKVADK